LAFAPKGKLLVSGCYDPILRLFKMDDLTPEVWGVLANESAPSRGISALAFSHNAKFLVATSHIGKETLGIWDASGAFLEEKSIPAAQARTVACSPTEPMVAFAGDDAEVHVWNIGGARVEKLRKLSGHPGKGIPPVVKALAFSPDGKILAS